MSEPDLAGRFLREHLPSQVAELLVPDLEDMDIVHILRYINRGPIFVS
jgi:hypothetical protein